MDEKMNDAADFWMEETHEFLSPPLKMKKRVRSKKMEFDGWASKPLLGFLESLGKDANKPMSQYDVHSIINDYINTRNLIDPQKKKKVLCDEYLQYLFGKKSVMRIQIYKLLEPHFAENQNESDDEYFYSSAEDGKSPPKSKKQQKCSSSDKKVLCPKKKAPEIPRSCFAAIIPANIKLVYLKRSLVQDLLKHPETFEAKVVGSFVRVKSDPKDYSQKNTHQLLHVIGVTYTSAVDVFCADILLQVSSIMKDINISKLSDDNFSEEECEDLRHRIKSGLQKRPTVVEFQQKAQMLHEDVTKHVRLWLARELNLLQNQIDRANEKGWRKELFEYLERKQLLQTPAEQSRLLLEVPEVVADEIEPVATAQDGCTGSAISISGVALEVSTSELDLNKPLELQNKPSIDARESGITIRSNKEWGKEHIETIFVPSRLYNKDNPPYERFIRDALRVGDFYDDGISLTQTIVGDLNLVRKEIQDSIREDACNIDPEDGISLTQTIVGDSNLVSKEIQVSIREDACNIDPEEDMDELLVQERSCQKQILATPIIVLSDDERDGEEEEEEEEEEDEMMKIWHYMDPQGEVQGPFTLELLQQWSDANYFPPNFQVWRTGQTPDEAVLLTQLLVRVPLPSDSPQSELRIYNGLDR